MGFKAYRVFKPHTPFYHELVCVLFLSLKTSRAHFVLKVADKNGCTALQCALQQSHQLLGCLYVGPPKSA